MEVSEENVAILQSMGFPSESEIRRALKLAKNDLGEAVGILTNDGPTGHYDGLEDLDVEMTEVDPRGPGGGRHVGQGPVYGPAPPPCYDEVVEASASDKKPVSVLFRDPAS